MSLKIAGNDNNNELFIHTKSNTLSKGEYQHYMHTWHYKTKLVRSCLRVYIEDTMVASMQPPETLKHLKWQQL